ncbi:MAG: AEC family transporter [Sulfurovaceae bacterium]|nr:AEC family transporter [Sulfurovaceae bacterium]MDD5549590.1 AEC family transporter [Sulfurovaceae bacterium]
MGQIYFIILLLSFGYILQFTKLPKNTSHILNQIVIYVSFPATVLLHAPKIEFSTNLLLPIITPWVVLLLSILFVFVVFREAETKTKAALLLLIPLGNTSFLGFPLIESILGKESLQYAILYDQLGSFLILAIYGTAVVSVYTHGVVNTKAIVKKIALFPPFIVLIYSFFIGYVPNIITPLVEILASTLTPFAIVSVGLSMKLRIDEHRAIFTKAILVKLILIPLIVLVIFKLLGFDDLVAQTTLLEVAMPSMITAGVLAINANFAPKLSASLVGYGILFSLVTVPLFSKLFELIN